jgi:hypothetical protein
MKKLTISKSKPKIYNLGNMFGIKKIIEFSSWSGDESIITLNLPNGSMLEMTSQGAIITRWKTKDGMERIWTRSGDRKDKSIFEGGIRPSFPQYGIALQECFRSLPKNGFIQLMKWEVVSTTVADHQIDRRPTVILRVQDTKKSLSEWPHEFELEYKISLGIPLSLKKEKCMQSLRVTTKNRIDLLSKEIESNLFLKEEGIQHFRKNSAKIASDLKHQTSDLHILMDMILCFCKRLSNFDDVTHRKRSFATTETSDSEAVEGVIAKRKRLEKERGQPAYFKYKITLEKSLSLTETFFKRGYPEDLHLCLTIENSGNSHFKSTVGLQTYLATTDTTYEYARILGLGLLPFLDISTPGIPLLMSDTSDSLFSEDHFLDRLYVNTKTPNELFFIPGDRTHLQIIEHKGFNNIHIFYPKRISNSHNNKHYITYSPCQAITPLELKAGEEWRARVTFRWYPQPFSVNKMGEDIGGKRDILAEQPEQLVLRRSAQARTRK